MKGIGMFLASVIVAASNVVFAAPSSYMALPRLLRADGQFDATSPDTVRIPRKEGPQADATLITYAAEIENVDLAIAQRKKALSADELQLRALTEARNVTMNEFLVGREVLLHTSGNGFPNSSKSKLDDYIAALKKGLTSTPSRENVQTRITFQSTGRATAMMYQSYADSSANSREWSTYTANQLLRMGTYVFEIRVIGSTTKCRELVLVLGDPTEKRICGWFVP